MRNSLIVLGSALATYIVITIIINMSNNSSQTDLEKQIENHKQYIAYVQDIGKSVNTQKNIYNSIYKGLDFVYKCNSKIDNLLSEQIKQEEKLSNIYNKVLDK